MTSEMMELFRDPQLRRVQMSSSIVVELDDELTRFLGGLLMRRQSIL